MQYVLLLTMLMGDGVPYSVDQPPPPPILGDDNAASISSKDEGFHLILGTMLSWNSDTAFPRFIGPSTNPTLTKDPRSLTEGRLLGIFNWSPSEHAWEGSLNQSYLFQARVALNKRWSVFLDKSGYSIIERGDSNSVQGWNNFALGAKYAMVRDVENQFLVATGIQFELPSGEASVYQRPNDGSVTAFLTAGKEFWCFWHVLGNAGVQIPMSNEGSGLFYTQLHIDRELMGWLYPLVEVNYYRIVSDGRGVLPFNYGQGDALFDWSVPGTVGSDLLTIAFGVKAKVNRVAEVGITYERPLSETPRVMEHRIVAELILRY